MKKSLILTMFGVSTFLIVREWYREGNSGLPTPNILAKPCYAFGALLLMVDFLENLAVVFALAMTVRLGFEAQSTVKKATTKAQNKSTANVIKATQTSTQKAGG